MGCILTQICASDDDELLHGADASSSSMADEKRPRFSRTATSLFTVAPQTHALPPRHSYTSTSSTGTTPASSVCSLSHRSSFGTRTLEAAAPATTSHYAGAVYRGGGIPGVALPVDQVDTREFTGAAPPITESGQPAAYCSLSGRLRWGAHSRAGHDPLRRRKENQDCLCVADALLQDHDATFFSVFDGHGPAGAYVSQFVRDAYYQQLARALQAAEVVPLHSERASPPPPLLDADQLTECFQHAATEVTRLLGESSMDISVSGTTAVGLLVCGQEVFLTNIGDSRAVVAVFAEPDDENVETIGGGDAVTTTSDGDGGGHELPSLGKYVVRHVTRDHKPESPDERARIEAHNGRVFEWGTFRVWLQDVDMPGLAMSRSFGDAVAKTVGVTSEPDVVVVDRVVHGVDGHPSFAVLASDGVWEFMSTDECVALVADCILNKSMGPQDACDALVAEALERWSVEEDVVDDISAVVVYF